MLGGHGPEASLLIVDDGIAGSMQHDPAETSASHRFLKIGG